MARGGPSVQQVPACYKLARGDLEAYVSTLRANRDWDINVNEFITGLYRPPDEKKVMDVVNDGLNRALRLNRPERERPAHAEEPRYQNYWQARYLMEMITDAIADLERQNGGKIKPARIFKKLDHDNDGYVSLSDLKSSCERLKVPNTHADLHALLSTLDQGDHGAVNISEFCQKWETYDGNMLDHLQRPVRGVRFEGGTIHGGPLQEKQDKLEKEQAAMARSASMPPPSRAGSERAGSIRSQMSPQLSRSATSSIRRSPSSPLIYDSQVARIQGKGRISDVIRSRFEEWKPQKSELYNSMPLTRFGATIYPDTRHITEPSVPLAAQYMSDHDRFKTTNNVSGMFAVPDHRHPQTHDDMNKYAKREYKIERMKARQRDFQERSEAANEAARLFDTQRIARKALNQLNYERRCHASG
eukprot:gnl/TRDRNA2_/TRDRNA2_86936_c2_seq1.p1 gnl/TRDRNA2_/TRDRNA2_86936_c2~~gnl/TRDRNA2_/TRDRNA2_86936_c2_seq1.p1  ORF type:complete len:432 (+),score=82.78 gnl/TRDRNA2_/TRDRNA2_86936_c2_seq1:50-1297(+)